MMDIDHVAFMKDDTQWPNWPLLPVKRGNPFDPGNLGIMLAGRGPKVILAGLFDLVGMSEEEKAALKVEEFDDYEGVFDAGWRVD